ncbi:MAG: FtsW/RodA/SpoVE family cell cycle protein [Eubacteriales bacterium]|nr:FtsW/RodA/SpoVE family cell cycle protein [Eubacteriales bacterium]
MRVYIVELSGYVIAALMLLYTVSALSGLLLRSGKKRAVIEWTQLVLLFLLQFSLFFTLAVVKRDMQTYFSFYLFQAAALAAACALVWILYPRVNRSLFHHASVLIVTGLAVNARLSYDRAARQFVIALVGLSAALALPFLMRRFCRLPVVRRYFTGLRTWKKLTWIYAAAGIFLLGIVLVLGAVTQGSKITYTVMGITLQPSEFVKLLFILFLAAALYRSADVKRVALVSAVSAVHVVILVLSRDLGSALIFFVIWLFVVWYATGKWYYPLAGIGIGAAGAVISYHLFSHVRVRVQAFLDPWSVIDGIGYQITQSLFSISNGGAFGQGLGQGSPDKIPYVESDFIFAAVAEELGLVFAVCLLILCLCCFMEMLAIAGRQTDRFCRLAVFGAAVSYIFQTFLTVGGEVRFIPLTGVTLPFVSYGGSSMLATIFLFALVEGCVNLQAEHEERIREVRRAQAQRARRMRRGSAAPQQAERLRMERGDSDARLGSRRRSQAQTQRTRRERPERAAELRGAKRRSMMAQWLFVALFGAMSVYFVHYAAVNRQELFDNDYNTRQSQLLEQNVRGSILAADGQVLAQTVTVVADDAAGTAAQTQEADTANAADTSDAQTSENDTANASAQTVQRREYPFGALFAHIVGYATKGRSGLEDAYNYELSHSDLTLSEKADYESRGEKYPGNNIVTTLDPALQQAASDAMGIYRGAIVVSDPATGEILAMVSKPDFDPNEISSEWEKLSQDEESAALLNRASQGLYPPGSTFKIMDAVEYLEEHPDDWEQYTFQCAGSFTRDGETIHCFHNESHGTVTFMESFAESCNSSFANIGLSLDEDRFTELLRTMMFGEELPYELPSSVSRTVLTESGEEASGKGEGNDGGISTKDRMQLAIGQGTTGMSPLHLNLITAAIANDGVLMKPYVVSSVQTASGTVLSRTEPQAYRQLMSADTAAQMRKLMEAVVEEGTATKLKGYGYTAAGKTGSAEYEDDSTASHAWFTGFAPAENPQVAVTVIIEGAGSGGDYAVPMARRVFDAYFAEAEGN